MRHIMPSSIFIFATFMASAETVNYGPPPAVTSHAILGDQWLAAPSGGDDYATIQAACGASPYTNVVHLAAGTWKVSQQLNCNNLIAEGGNCYFWYEGHVCPTVIQQIAGTWAANDAIVRATPGQPAYYRGFEVHCAVSNGADGVSGFELGTMHGVELVGTRAYRCNYGYSVWNGLTQQINCIGCFADQNQLWGFAVRVDGTDTSMADSQFSSGYIFSNNGQSTTETGPMGGVFCGYCVTSAFMGGQIEDHYGTVGNGWAGAGIYLTGVSQDIRISGNKFDQNSLATLVFDSQADNGVALLSVTGNVDTTCAYPCFGSNVDTLNVLVTGTKATRLLHFANNIWHGAIKADDLTGIYGSQLVGSTFCGDVFLDVNLATNAFTRALLAPLTCSLGIVPGGTAQATPADPATTTSLTPVMAGFAVPFITTGSGKVLITASGHGYNSANDAGLRAQISYGTGTAPVSGAAVTGTQVGNLAYVQSTNFRTGFNTNAAVALTPNTTYWLDLAYMAETGGTASMLGVSISTIEVP